MTGRTSWDGEEVSAAADLDAPEAGINPDVHFPLCGRVIVGEIFIAAGLVEVLVAINV
jgi:hypothetical protein